MEILVSGSLAYDRIMDFPGRFADHILPERIHMLNVSFTVNGLSENFGGTAGNIAYSLWLQGEKARIIAAIGQDYHRYFEWLAQLGLDTGGIRRAEGELTAGAYITTDADNNQITGFNPGAMKQQAGFDFSGIDPQNAIAIISPGNLADMQEFSAWYHRRGLRAIFDPGQSLPLWGAEDLARCIRQSWALVTNDYEFELTSHITGQTAEELAGAVEHLVVTKGAEGAELISGGRKTLIPGVPVAAVVDPTGAGDAFRGGLIKGLIQGETMERAVQRGAVCGHYAVQTHGTQTYTYTPQQFQQTLQQRYG